jgi:RNA polymerase sigma-70 factor (ECF subfamily)
MDKEDKLLVENYLDGDESALEVLINKYFSLIYNYVSRLVPKDEASDLVQDVFVRVWKSIKKIDFNKASFKTWIFTIARNRVIDYFKKKKSIPFSSLDNDKEPFSETIIDEGSFVEEEILKTENLEILNEALNKIDEKHREILILYYQEDMTFKEIGQLLNKPLNTVKSYHYRAVLKLRDFLKDMHQN